MINSLTNQQRIDSIISTAKKYKIGYLKIELEGNSGNGYSDGCDYCSDGEVSCYNCDGMGDLTLRDNNDNEYSVDCAECEGSCYTECQECYGNSNNDSYDDLYDSLTRDLTSEQRATITHGHCYHDGSVEDEATITVDILNKHGVSTLVNLTKRWGELMSDTEGAGMHMAFLPVNSNGRYPNHGANFEGNSENFRTQVTKLLGAMYFLATPNHTTRSLGYRGNRVDYIHNEKYNAITMYNNGSNVYAIEYRIFDTCYYKPEQIIFNIEVMLKAFYFYANGNDKVKQTDYSFSTSNVDGYYIGNFYKDINNYRTLLEYVSYLLPDGYSFEALAKTRGVKQIDDKKRLLAEYKEVSGLIASNDWNTVYSLRRRLLASGLIQRDYTNNTSMLVNIAKKACITDVEFEAMSLPLATRVKQWLAVNRPNSELLIKSC